MPRYRVMKVNTQCVDVEADNAVAALAQIRESDDKRTYIPWFPVRINEIDLVGMEVDRMYRRCSNCGHLIDGKCLLSGGVATIKGKILKPTSVWCSEWEQREVVLREPLINNTDGRGWTHD